MNNMLDRSPQSRHNLDRKGYHAPDPGRSKAGGGYPAHQPAPKKKAKGN